MKIEELKPKIDESFKENCFYIDITKNNISISFLLNNKDIRYYYIFSNNTVDFISSNKFPDDNQITLIPYTNENLNLFDKEIKQILKEKYQKLIESVPKLLVLSRKQKLKKL